MLITRSNTFSNESKLLRVVSSSEFYENSKMGCGADISPRVGDISPLPMPQGSVVSFV